MKPDLTLKKHQKTADLKAFSLKALFLIGLTSPILAMSGEAGTALKADNLRSTPFADAKSVGTLSKNDAVDIVAKKGAWLQVTTQKVPVKKALVGCDCYRLNVAAHLAATKLKVLLMWLAAARELAKWFLPQAFAD